MATARWQRFTGPRRFVERVGNELGNANGRPTFLALHFCLPHWPYYWADEAPVGAKNSYAQSVAGVDRQFGELKQMLEIKGYWNEQTLVVLLADHGESFEAHRLALPAVDAAMDDSVNAVASGHGGTLFSADQWRTWVMFAGAVGRERIPAGRSDALASLADVAPTIAQLLHLDFPRPFVMDVARTMDSKDSHALRASVALETGFRPARINLTAPDGDEVMRAAATDFDFADDGRVELKAQVARDAIERKDFGVTNGAQAIIALDATSALNVKPLYVDFAAMTANTLSKTKATPDSAEDLLIKAACADADLRGRMLAGQCGPSEIAESAR